MTAPAVLIAIPLIIGVLLGSVFPTELAAVRAGLVVAWIAAGIAIWRHWSAALTTGIVAGFVLAGAIAGGSAAREARQPPLLSWFREFPRDGPVRVTAVLREDSARTGTGVSLVMDATDVSGAPGNTIHGGIRATVTGALAAVTASDWRAGRMIRADVLLREPLDYRDPGVPSDRDRLARQGIALLGTIKSAALVTVVEKGNPISESAAALRAFVRANATRAIAPWHQRSAAIATAILIGDRGGLDPDDERRLQEAGTYHVIAISGGNIALLSALLVVVGRMAHIPARPTAAASMALLAFYGYAAGLAPSVLRATLAGVIYLAGRATDHRGAALNAVAVAGAIAAVAAPMTLLDPGFILSFGATLSIVIAASRLAAIDRRRHPAANPLRLWMRRLADAARMLFAATLCAEIALAPVGARLFGRISLAGLILNFVAIPLMSIIQVAGLAAVAVMGLSVHAGLACGWIVQAGTRLLLRSASLVDVAPWLVMDVPPPALWLIAAWYTGWCGLLAGRKRPLRAASTVVVITACALIVVGHAATRAVSVPRAPDGWTRIAFLDVGQGDATLIQPPDGLTLLIDAGGVPGSSFDLGRRVTLPTVWAFGVSRLGALVLTHGDPDHIGGAPPILRALRPREIWDGIPVPSHEPMQRLRDAAQRAHIPWIERRTGESLGAETLRIRVLNPPEPTWERRRVRNDDSIVLELRIGDVAVVLPGDITHAVEPGVVAAFEPAPMVILKAPHHGSAGSSSQVFIDALHPAAVIFSAGKRNPFGHPAPAVIERYKAAGAQVFSTADDGAVVMETDGRQVLFWTWSGVRISLMPAVADGITRRH
ncbi:MAG TPA: DNA internalization-related competence protein ComEC/Rec2 [Vicinamibacterales bacterium]|nr:DNA internalization-related competence protein ComEC/Rec2 [Vicinamibacterales bacterium]